MRDTCEIHAGYMRVAKDGKHYRIIEHTTGYFYQEGFLPSQTEEQDAD